MKKTILITLICIFIFLVVVESYIIGYGYNTNPYENIINPEDKELFKEKSPVSNLQSDAAVPTDGPAIDLTADNKNETNYEMENRIDDLVVDENYEYITDSKIKDVDLSIVTTDKNIYVKKNGKWDAVLKYGIKESVYFTSCEIVNIENDTYIFAGTSYAGIYFKPLKMKDFTRIEGLRPPFATAKGMNYVETVNKMFIINDHLYIGYSYSAGIQRINLKDKKFKVQDTSIEFISDADEKISKFYYAGDRLFAESNYGLYSFNETNTVWNLLEKFESKNEAAEMPVRGIYLNPYAVSSEKKVDKYIKIANDLGINAFVIDLKDDYGYVDYDTQVPLAHSFKAKRKVVKLDYLLEKCKVLNIKVIARIVSFKDYMAYDYNNNELALWDITTNKAWEGSKGEKWVDPYSESYQQYLIDLARELEAKGVDEIQFDYVRFPSDGQTYKIKYRYKNGIKSKNILIYSFFKKAKSQINIPVTADFYGYNCWYKMNEYIGQDLYLASAYLDAIYPMYYPSHFSKGFYQLNLTQYETNFYIYYHGTKRAFENARRKSNVRPWIQVFKMKVDIPYKDYISAQLYGITNAGIESFIFWNAGGDYDILYDIL